MCGCTQGTCPGNCPCGCRHTPPIQPVDPPSRIRVAGRRLKQLATRVVGTFRPTRHVPIPREDLEDDGEYYLGLVPCWCGDAHEPDYWHDPTHGQIDRDIQDKVTAHYGDDLPLAQRVAIESTLQHRRDRGLPL